MQNSYYRRRARKRGNTNRTVALPCALLIYTACIVVFVGMLAIVSIIGWLVESIWHVVFLIAGISALLGLGYLWQLRHKVVQRTTYHAGRAVQTVPLLVASPMPPMPRSMPPKSRSDTGKTGSTGKQGSAVYWGKQRVGWCDAAGQMHFDQTSRSAAT